MSNCRDCARVTLVPTGPLIFAVEPGGETSLPPRTCRISCCALEEHELAWSPASIGDFIDTYHWNFVRHLNANR
eukprot:scaffold7199_cov133-Skeletonema_marinoi.AAC.6